MKCQIFDILSKGFTKDGPYCNVCGAANYGDKMLHILPRHYNLEFSEVLLCSWIRYRSKRKSQQIGGQMMFSGLQDLEFNSNFAKHRDSCMVINSVVVTQSVTTVMRATNALSCLGVAGWATRSLNRKGKKTSIQAVQASWIEIQNFKENEHHLRGHLAIKYNYSPNHFQTDFDET